MNDTRRCVQPIHHDPGRTTPSRHSTQVLDDKRYRLREHRGGTLRARCHPRTAQASQRTVTITTYHEYEASAEYLHLLMRPAWEQLRSRLATVLEGVDPDAGALLELGPGSGIGTSIMLDTVPDVPLLTAEPSPALRAVLIGRLADRSDAHRVTVYPTGATDLPLPERLAGVVALHMIGHLRPEERCALWSALASRLAPGAPVVVNTQPPDTAISVPVSAPFTVTSGELTYEGRGGAEPSGPESVRWTMSYRTLRGDVVLSEATAQYDWWTVSTATLATELRAAGLEVAQPTDDLVVARAVIPAQAAGPARQR